MLCLSATSSSMIRSAVSRMASWEVERGSWGGGGLEKKHQKPKREMVCIEHCLLLKKSSCIHFCTVFSIMLERHNLGKGSTADVFAQRIGIMERQA